MMERTQWILFFSIVGCALTAAVIALLLVLHKRHAHYHHGGNTPPGDIGPIATSIDDVKTAVRDSREETAAASQGIRQQMDTNQTTIEMELDHSRKTLNWIKAVVQRWFTKHPGEPPSDGRNQ
jgi:hypothetical protein